MGVRLIDRECKGDSKPKAKSAASSVLVLHSVEQLAYKKTALSMLTTNQSITFFKAFKDTPTAIYVSPLMKVKNMTWTWSEI